MKKINNSPPPKFIPIYKKPKGTKILYIDLETTGLNPYKNGVIQIAGIIEINGKEVRSFNYKIKPFKEDLIDLKALGVSSTTLEDLKGFKTPLRAYKDLLYIFDKYIDKYDRKDKFIVCGYNVKFDLDFLKQFWKKNGDNYLFSYIGKVKDPLFIIQWLEAMNKMKTQNNTLTTICSFFDIKLENAHDAMADITATKELAKRLDKLLEDVEVPMFWNLKE